MSLVVSECKHYNSSSVFNKTKRTGWEWLGELKSTPLCSNVSSFAVEGVNLIDASVLNSRLTYCVVQPFDSFQIILLLILTQPFIIICILPTVLKALAFIVSPMFCNPISDAHNICWYGIGHMGELSQGVYFPQILSLFLQLWQLFSSTFCIGSIVSIISMGQSHVPESGKPSFWPVTSG